MGKENCNDGCCHGGENQSQSEIGVHYSLYKKVDMENLECLNEEVDGSGRTVFKPFDERMERTKFVMSDTDEELLFNIPFTGNIKLKSIRVAGEDDQSHPKVVKMYKNRPKMGFSDTSAKCDQEIILSKDIAGEIEYTVKIPIFSGVYHLSLYFPTNYGHEKTKIYYIGLEGEYSNSHRHGVTICNYEVTPNIKEHQNSLRESHDFSIH